MSAWTEDRDVGVYPSQDSDQGRVLRLVEKMTAEMSNAGEVMRKSLARIAELESALRSAAIVEEHLRATIKALTTSGHYDAGKLEEGLDGQVLREGKFG